MSYILLTRPLSDTIELENALHLPVLRAPLLEVELVISKNEPVVTDYNNLIVTSARALKIFSKINAFLKKPIWCVGSKTAQLAKGLGFETIYAAENSAIELCQLILSKTTPQTEKFLHICGECLHYDIIEKLCEEGYKADKLALYKTISIERFEADVLNAFLNYHIVMIPVFSHKTAMTLANTMRYHKLEPYLKNITLVACAQQNTIPLQQFNWQDIVILQDLSVSTLSVLYRKIIAKKEMDMSLKKLWPWLAMTGLISIFISLGGALMGKKFFQLSTFFDTQTVQASLQTEISQNAAKNDIEFNELKMKMMSLQEEFEAFKNVRSTPSSQNMINIFLKTYIIVSDVLEQLKSGNINQNIWQEMINLLQNIQVKLPEDLSNLKEIPFAKQELLQQLKETNQPDSPQIVAQSVSQPLMPNWLTKMQKKVEQYVGKIVIRKTENLSLLPNSYEQVKDNIFNAVNNDDEVQMIILIEENKISEESKKILINAQKRLQILQKLKELKPLLWQLSKENKE